MKEERMQVLEMLAEGKINADEAERLLALLTKTNKSERSKEVVCDINEKTAAFNEKVNAAVKEFVDKIDRLTKDVEPKLKKAAQIVVENTVSTVDELSKTFNETVKKEEDTCCCQCEEESQAEEENQDEEESKEN